MTAEARAIIKDRDLTRGVVLVWEWLASCGCSVPFLKDPLMKGQYTNYLYTKDILKAPKFPLGQPLNKGQSGSILY